jgi:chromosome segregation ATPase
MDIELYNLSTDALVKMVQEAQARTREISRTNAALSTRMYACDQTRARLKRDVHALRRENAAKDAIVADLEQRLQNTEDRANAEMETLLKTQRENQELHAKVTQQAEAMAQHKEDAARELMIVQNRSNFIEQRSKELLDECTIKSERLEGDLKGVRAQVDKLVRILAIVRQKAKEIDDIVP